MNETLRRSAAHVIVDDAATPVLTADDRHHLERVLRLRDGEAVTCTDGRGSWVRTSWAGGDLRLDGDVNREQQPDPQLSVVVAPLKGDRTDLVVEKLVEIGVDRIVVLEPTERSVVRWGDGKSDTVMERYRRIVRSAVMQSRRVFVPEVVGPVSLAAVAIPGAAFAEPGGPTPLSEITSLVIGPEGGFSSSELALAHASVDLGPAILRAETAAMVGAARLVAHWRR